MSVRLPSSTALAIAIGTACLLPGLANALGTPQGDKHIAYPQRDLLSPFRNPVDAYAPPDEAYRLLRIMQAIAEAPNSKKSFDQNGREVVDDRRWHETRTELLKVGLQAGYLAQIMRLNRSVADRATAFYAAFHVADIDHVFELIGHIPGEPARRTRETAMPRAIEFVRANLRRRFGDLSDEHKRELAKALPQVGSPAAKAAGIVRAPRDEDHLHKVPLVPFFQLLDLDEAIDQAQGLWFLKEVFQVRLDLALVWLEPALPRVRQLLLSESAQVREQAIGLVQAIAPKDVKAPPADDPQALVAWADAAAKTLFPPIRNLNDAILQLHPSPERDAIAAAGVAALQTSAIGDPFQGRRKDGTHFQGFRVARVPDELKQLAIPEQAVVTTVNGVTIRDATTLLDTVREQLRVQKQPRRLLVEYVLGGEPHAVEYRVL